MINLSVATAFVGLVFGGVLASVVTLSVTAILVHHLFVDLLAAMVPDPLSDEILEANPDIKPVFGFLKSVTPKAVKRFAAVTLGKEAGAFDAKAYNAGIKAQSYEHTPYSPRSY